MFTLVGQPDETRGERYKALPPKVLVKILGKYKIGKASESGRLAKHRDTRLAFALPLKFCGRYCRFPRDRADLPTEAVEAAPIGARLDHSGAVRFRYEVNAARARALATAAVSALMS